MGARNLTLVMIGGEYKVAQYGQWDGYPSGQGKTALRFLRDEMSEQFLTNVCGCREGTDDEVKATWTEAGADPNTQWVTLDVGNKHTKLYPELSRDTGAGILALIQEKPRMLALDPNFAADSVFCEWAYVVDLDKMTFEVYKGFNKERLKPGERFAALRSDHTEYEPIKHVITYDLNQPLPTDEDFIAEVDKLTGRDDEG